MPTDVIVERLVESAASGRTVEVVQPMGGAPLVYVNGSLSELPPRTDVWELAAVLMYRCGMDSAGTARRQHGMTFTDSGIRVLCANVPFDGRLLLQLVAG